MDDRILCLVPGDLADPCLVRGCALARTLNAELFVARMGNRGLRVEPLFRAFDDRAFIDLLAGLEDEDTLVPTRGIVDYLVSETTRIAFELAVTMVVIPVELAHRAVALTELLRVPVLVARPARGTSVVIAADLLQRGRMVVAIGHKLASKLAASVTVVHNRGPTSTDPGLHDAVIEHLSATSWFGARAVTITRASSTVAGVLEVARIEAADVIVVGVHPRSWLRRALDNGVPERLAREAGRSVLIVPVSRIEA